MNFSIIVLFVVFILIAVRQVGNIRLQIWQIMFVGAVAVTLSQNISLQDSWLSINWDVILFLFGMFVVGQALEESGYLSHISYKYFKKFNSIDTLILALMFGVGIGSAVLMNDTLAIIGTPVVLLLAKKHRMSPKLLLLTLAFAITIGSVASPIGNPQNLLIAINGKINNPFLEFLKWLFIPTVINLIFAYLLLRIFYKRDFHSVKLSHSQEPILDKKLARLSKISLQLIVILIIIKIMLAVLNVKIDFRLTYIALLSCLPIIIFSKRRISIIKKIDWHTLIFFVSMFVLMEAVWLSGWFQGILDKSNLNIHNTGSILTVSIILSQFISNVPMVALYQPLLIKSGAYIKEFMALAAGSTIAGNLFILGAASNVIIIQNAEKKYKQTLTFWDFAKIGIPLTFINIIVYWIYFEFIM